MAILKIDITPPIWIIPETTGQTPEPRMLQTSVYNQNLNCIILFAGRNDIMKSPYLNDIYLLTLDSLTWIKVIRTLKYYYRLIRWVIFQKLEQDIALLHLIRKCLF